MFECDLAHHCSVAVLCVLFKIRCNPMHPLCGALPVPVQVTCGTVIAHRFTYAPPRSIAGLLFPYQYLCGTILVTSCSMVWVLWDWQVSRAEPMPFYWPSCSLTFCLLLFSFSLLSFCGLVLWGWGLRTHRVLIALSLPCIANLF